MVEQVTVNHLVDGSSPSRGANKEAKKAHKCAFFVFVANPLEVMLLSEVLLAQLEITNHNTLQFF